jgi:hypothetical protein
VPVESQVFLQVALVFGLIGLLGLVLRWAFRRDGERSASSRARRRRPVSPPSGGSVGTDSTPPVATGAPAREDYGLLAVAAEVATLEEVANLRRVLTAAGIRSTTATTADGKHKVLVFGDQLIRARRVAGGARGTDGTTTGS